MIAGALAILAGVAYDQRRRAVRRLSYKTFLLTLPSSKERRRSFFSAHDPSVPIEIVYGKDTKQVDVARQFESRVDPRYMERALAMHWNPGLNRPDLTYFNLGAIGAYFGHLDVLSKARAQGIKYALVMEDNVVPTPRLYEEVERALREKGDSFEAIFFHCIARLTDGFDGSLERVKWISSMKCYLVHVPNMFPYYKKHMRVMNNHVDTKMEDVAAAGARIFFKDMGHCAKINRSVASEIGHNDHDKVDFFSKRYTDVDRNDLTFGTW